MNDFFPWNSKLSSLKNFNYFLEHEYDYLRGCDPLKCNTLIKYALLLPIRRLKYHIKLLLIICNYLQQCQKCRFDGVIVKQTTFLIEAPDPDGSSVYIKFCVHVVWLHNVPQVTVWLYERPLEAQYFVVQSPPIPHYPRPCPSCKVPL